MSENETTTKSPLGKLVWVALLGLIPLAMLYFSKGENKSAQLYQQHCANCHMDDGKGLKNLYPPLAGADYLLKHEAMLPCIIKHGVQGEMIVNGKQYNMAMPGNKSLSDVDITNLINYIRNEWGNEHPHIPLNQVKQILEKCEHN
ncbi:MAG: c-type cytochrome [Flammeovirgaceae bacterium]